MELWVLFLVFVSASGDAKHGVAAYLVEGYEACQQAKVIALEEAAKVPVSEGTVTVNCVRNDRIQTEDLTGVNT